MTRNEKVVFCKNIKNLKISVDERFKKDEINFFV